MPGILIFAMSLDDTRYVQDHKYSIAILYNTLGTGDCGDSDISPGPERAHKKRQRNQDLWTYFCFSCVRALFQGVISRRFTWLVKEAAAILLASWIPDGRSPLRSVNLHTWLHALSHKSTTCVIRIQSIQTWMTAERAIAALLLSPPIGSFLLQ